MQTLYYPSSDIALYTYTDIMVITKTGLPHKVDCVNSDGFCLMVITKRGLPHKVDCVNTDGFCLNERTHVSHWKGSAA